MTGVFFTQNAKGTPFTPTGANNATNVQDAIVEARGVNQWVYRLHYGDGANLNVTMSNSSFFRVYPGTFSSGSYSGYPTSFPERVPYDCFLQSAGITFRNASFDYNVISGSILWDLEIRNHVYNGSSINSTYTVPVGDFSGNQTGHSTWKFLVPVADMTIVSGSNEYMMGDMIGCRFVKTSSGDRRINSFTDIVLDLIFEETI